MPRERSIRYLPGRFDAYYSAKEAGKNHRLEALLYPNSLVTVKTLPLPEDFGEMENVTISKYTKHYYIGSERVASALGSIKSLGMLCEGLAYADAALIAEMNDKVEDAGELMGIIHNTFEKDPRCAKSHDFAISRLLLNFQNYTIPSLFHWCPIPTII